VSEFDAFRELEESAMRAFAEVLAEGECLCAKIDPSDKPCLTCGAKGYLAEEHRANHPKDGAT
jgi:hypothetical protein